MHEGTAVEWAALRPQPLTLLALLQRTPGALPQVRGHVEAAQREAAPHGARHAHVGAHARPGDEALPSILLGQ
eukprot:scaffold80463_cov54-Phaeocystis_antarctica.AAC.2